MGTNLAVVDTKGLGSQLEEIRKRVAGIVVKTQEDYITTCQVVLDIRAYVKDAERKMKEETEPLKNKMQSIQNEFKTFIEPAKILAESASQRAEAWKRAEREAAQKEQDEINRKAREATERENEKARAEARKNHVKLPEPVAAPLPVQVVPAVPKVAGIKARVNWKFRITDATKLPREFLMADEVKIGQYVRDRKQAGQVIPGVEAYSEDGI